MCGVCTDKCHSYLGSADPRNMPVAHQDLLRSVYRRYYTFAGKWFPKLVGARDMTSDVLDEWYSYFNQCSECRRCAVFCPLGIDTAEIAMAAREIMDSVGRGQKYSNEVIGKVFKFGNNLGLPERALANTLESLEEDVEDETGIKVRFPLDEKGAEVLLMAPFDFLDARYPVPQHICEVTYDLMKRGLLKFDKSRNDHMKLTFHDSCNVARTSRMGNGIRLRNAAIRLRVVS